MSRPYPCKCIINTQVWFRSSYRFFFNLCISIVLRIYQLTFTTLLLSLSIICTDSMWLTTLICKLYDLVLPVYLNQYIIFFLWRRTARIEIQGFLLKGFAVGNAHCKKKGVSINSKRFKKSSKTPQPFIKAAKNVFLVFNFHPL